MLFLLLLLFFSKQSRKLLFIVSYHSTFRARRASRIKKDFIVPLQVTNSCIIQVCWQKELIIPIASSQEFCKVGSELYWKGVLYLAIKTCFLNPFSKPTSANTTTVSHGNQLYVGQQMVLLFACLLRLEPSNPQSLIPFSGRHSLTSFHLLKK